MSKSNTTNASNSGTPLRLNLGSGNEPLHGYLNIDRRRVAGIALQADARCLPVQSHSAREICASSLLEHFANPYEILDEVHRVLHPDGTFTIRVPAPWSQSALLDKSHLFLADLKLWRQILRGYFDSVKVIPEGVRYRDNKLLVAIQFGAIHGLRMFEFAQAWRFNCSNPVVQPTRAYIPWWLE